MELLKMAMVDISTLVAACHALRSAAAEDEAAVGRKLRSRLHRDLKRGTLAYIDTLVRTRRGSVDAALLSQCRVAAEQRMPQALAHQALLGGIMGQQAGSLDGLAAVRQDLWQLAGLAIHLSRGLSALRESGAGLESAATDSVGGRLRRRLRKALLAYARTALRSKAAKGRMVIKARKAALAEIGARAAVQARRLAAIESAALPALPAIWLGVTRPLLDLVQDWQHREATCTAPRAPQALNISWAHRQGKP